MISIQPLLSQNLSVAIKTNYTTTSKLYSDISKSSEFTMDSYSSIDGIWGLGIDARKNLYENKIFIGLSGEYISGTMKTQSPFANLSYLDGFSIMLSELNGYLIIPLSSETLKMYIGGGINIAFGQRIKEISNISVENLKNPTSFGIQVMTGLEYFFFKDFSFRWEMKFRDPEIETESKFTQNLTYNNVFYQLPKSTVKSKINLDGIVFDFSLVYNF